MASPAPDDLAQLAPRPWDDALRLAPRHMFVPDIAWTTKHELIDHTTDPDSWWDAVNSNTAIVTQIDDGNTELTGQSPWMTLNHSSSCSAPGMVFDFLTLLVPYPGDRVLEIGTGTGWTAALLSARIGTENVTTVEVDDRVAKQAAANLERAGHAPTLVVGDGAEGYAEGAPYDRVHVTCGVRDIPYAWVEQARPGGVIVLPWMHGTFSAGHKTMLTVTGEAAVGRFHGECAYMMLRSQRERHPPITGEERESIARVDPRRIARAGPGLDVTVAGMLPAVSVSGGTSADGSYRVALRHEPSDAHALAVRPPAASETEVTQRGSRDLWDELEAAYLAWVGRGTPGVERFGLAITPAGQYVWLDSPDNPLGQV
ncbi:methyltransferase domain-containing protein [Halostreptopolyspora alba]|uniref:Protein-L-isoaspartate O-methyltransferase n=1 Tax=Halostreptopolyspora alba TaxID=2487137 RepID=A0A3N0E865_9ACTN|nr:methyltransferase domain-containing protein [Nocardiopsaceae bacterium YIM 96095]